MPLFDAALVAFLMFGYSFLGLGLVWAAAKAVEFVIDRARGRG